MIVKIKESKVRKESYDNYEIKTLTMDVAVKKGDKLEVSGAGFANHGLWEDFSKVLEKHGYEMAGDYIDVKDGQTKVYVDNEYEFFSEDKSESLSESNSTDDDIINKFNQLAGKIKAYRNSLLKKGGLETQSKDPDSKLSKMYNEIDKLLELCKDAIASEMSQEYYDSVDKEIYSDKDVYADD